MLKAFFQENPHDLSASDYIAAQEPWQRDQLKKFVAELETTRKIDHPDARDLGDGRWSLWTRQEGQDATNHICYLDRAPASELSSLAQEILNPGASKSAAAGSHPGGRLFVVGESGRPGEEPSLWEPEAYSARMDNVQAGAFLEVINAIRLGQTSPHYTALGNGEYQVHIDRPELAYGVHLHCLVRRK